MLTINIRFFMESAVRNSTTIPKTSCALTSYFCFEIPQIEVIRSYEATAALLRTLQSTANEAQGPQSTTGLEASFTALFANRADLTEEPWNCTPLLEFLDDGPLPGVLASSTVVLMKNKVSFVTLLPLRSSLFVQVTRHVLNRLRCFRSSS
jgi:hypothetical protein